LLQNLGEYNKQHLANYNIKYVNNNYAQNHIQSKSVTKYEKASRLPSQKAECKINLLYDEY